MSNEQADVPFRKVLDLCERHGFKLMRIVDGVRVFWRPNQLDPADPQSWLAVEVDDGHCVKPSVYHRLQQFFQDFRDVPGHSADWANTSSRSGRS